MSLQRLARSGLRRPIYAYTDNSSRLIAMEGLVTGSATPCHSLVNQAYNPLTNSWANVGNCNYYQQQSAITVDSSGRFYKLGGTYFPVASPSTCGATQSISNLCEMFDPATDSWQTIATLPNVTRIGGLLYPDRPYCWSHNNNVYLWGTANGGSSGNRDPGISIYSGGSWVHHNITTYGTAGIDYPNHLVSGAYPVRHTNLVFKNLNISRRDGDGRFYVFGDWNIEAEIPQVWRYNTGSNTFSRLADNPQVTGLSGSILQTTHRLYSIPCFVPAENAFFVVGGASGSFNEILKKFYKYSISTNTWTELTDCPVPVFNFDGIFDLVTKDDGMLYLISLPTGKILRYEIALDRWSLEERTHYTTQPGTVSYDGVEGWYLMENSRTNNPSVGENNYLSRFVPEVQRPVFVFGWGENSSGQLGVGDYLDKTTPTLAVGLPPFPDRPVKVVTNGRATAVLMDNGTVWTTGSNTFGDLGQDISPVFVSSKNVFERITQYDPVGGGLTYPQPMPFIADITAGDCFFALSIDGTPLPWGRNQFQSSGTGIGGNLIRPYRSIPALESFRDVSAGSDFSVCMNTVGRAYSVGLNDWGQLGRAAGSYTTTPQTTWLPLDNFPATTAFSGWWSGEVAAGEKALLIKNFEDIVYGAGRGDDYRLGDGIFGLAGSRTNAMIPLTDIPSNVVAEIRQTGSLTWFRYWNGDVISWGNDNLNGARGSSSILNPTQVPLPLDDLPGLVLTKIQAYVPEANPTYVWGEILVDPTPPVLQLLPLNATDFVLTVVNNGNRTITPSIYFYDFFNTLLDSTTGSPIAVSGSDVVVGTPPVNYYGMVVAFTVQAPLEGASGTVTATLNITTAPTAKLLAWGGSSNNGTGLQHFSTVGNDLLLYSWGYGGLNQFGDGSLTNSLTPTSRSGLVLVVGAACAQGTQFVLTSEPIPPEIAVTLGSVVFVGV